jgi:hypothetical protein
MKKIIFSVMTIVAFLTFANSVHVNAEENTYQAKNKVVANYLKENKVLVDNLTILSKSIEDPVYSLKLSLFIENQTKNDIEIGKAADSVLGQNFLSAFLLGPDSTKIESIKKYLSFNNNQNLQLTSLRSGTNKMDESNASEYSSIMEKLKQNSANFEAKINKQQTKFSLFGWMKK